MQSTPGTAQNAMLQVARGRKRLQAEDANRLKQGGLMISERIPQRILWALRQG